MSPDAELMATNHSNVTKDKLLEWQSTWQHFCDEDLGYEVSSLASPILKHCLIRLKDLDSRQFQAALASLGHVYSTDEFLQIYDDLVRRHGAVTYKAFVEFLVSW